MGLQIEHIKIADIKAYAGNAKKHTDKQVAGIRRSIEAFGFNDPVAVDENNVLIEGHGRLAALKQMGWTEVDAIRLTHLTDAQKRAYVHAHNELTLETGFDMAKLQAEIAKISEDLPTLDMSDFGFQTDAIMRPLPEYRHETQHRKENILNLAVAQFPGVGVYDIPEILPEPDVPDVEEWIGINNVLSEPHPANKGVHFFKDDYQFERVWSEPERWIDRLCRFAVVMAPDFSPYGDMPLAAQLWNHYRKHWCARLWQEAGITVIPTIRASTDPRSLLWFTDGEPQGSPVAYSSMWIREDRKDAYAAGKAEWETMVERLHPSKVYVYGRTFPFMDGTPTQRITKFTEKKWGRG